MATEAHEEDALPRRRLEAARERARESIGERVLWVGYLGGELAPKAADFCNLNRLFQHNNDEFNMMSRVAQQWNTIIGATSLSAVWCSCTPFSFSTIAFHHQCLIRPLDINFKPQKRFWHHG